MMTTPRAQMRWVEGPIIEEDLIEILFILYQRAGGAAMNAIIKTEVAVNKVGIIKTPNHPM
jgi:hypothetical protein